jgi:type I site-specific restriction-modification system R (restriction) subunit
MKRMFPKACYLGFTGTPLMKKEKSTAHVRKPLFQPSLQNAAEEKRKRTWTDEI